MDIESITGTIYMSEKNVTLWWVDYSLTFDNSKNEIIVKKARLAPVDANTNNINSVNQEWPDNSAGNNSNNINGVSQELLNTAPENISNYIREKLDISERSGANIRRWWNIPEGCIFIFDWTDKVLISVKDNWFNMVLKNYWVLRNVKVKTDKWQFTLSEMMKDFYVNWTNKDIYDDKVMEKMINNFESN
jgi:hypothetical protein